MYDILKLHFFYICVFICYRISNLHIIIYICFNLFNKIYVKVLQSCQVEHTSTIKSIHSVSKNRKEVSDIFIKEVLIVLSMYLPLDIKRPTVNQSHIPAHLCQSFWLNLKWRYSFRSTGEIFSQNFLFIQQIRKFKVSAGRK